MTTSAHTPSPRARAAGGRMPAFYIPHGAGPCFFMDWNPPDTWDRTAAYLRGIPASLPAAPSAIALVTAHWLAPQVTLTGSAQPGLLFDYYGFPPHTYELRYPAPGAPALAERARGLLADAGIAAAVDAQRGYDHGTFIPLKVAFPDADIPVLQLSLLESLNAADHNTFGGTRTPRPAAQVAVWGLSSGLAGQPYCPALASSTSSANPNTPDARATSKPSAVARSMTLRRSDGCVFRLINPRVSSSARTLESCVFSTRVRLDTSLGVVSGSAHTRRSTRSAWPSPAGVSTCTACQGTSSWAAMRAQVRTTFSPVSPGPTQASRASRLGQTGATALARR